MNTRIRILILAAGAAAMTGVNAQLLDSIIEAGRSIGHAARDVTREIGHASRDAVQAVGDGARETGRDIGRVFSGDVPPREAPREDRSVRRNRDGDGDDDRYERDDRRGRSDRDDD